MTAKQPMFPRYCARRTGSCRWRRRRRRHTSAGSGRPHRRRLGSHAAVSSELSLWHGLEVRGDPRARSGKVATIRSVPGDVISASLIVVSWH